MTAPRHRGAHSRARPPRTPRTPRIPAAPRASARALTGLVLAGTVLGSFAGVRAVADGDEGPRTNRFAGVVTEFTDDGAVMCVQPRKRPEAPFCDRFYVPPDTSSLRVGDDVLVTTIASRTETGAHVSGMLVAPLH
ncbi:MAG TPA: hypothetical protein VHG70_10185 [Nocardioidaceae bacterium]|nr:hypothetical protein [Nocardioidaceae bacterium]